MRLLKQIVNLKLIVEFEDCSFPDCGDREFEILTKLLIFSVEGHQFSMVSYLQIGFIEDKSFNDEFNLGVSIVFVKLECLMQRSVSLPDINFEYRYP